MYRCRYDSSPRLPPRPCARSGNRANSRVQNTKRDAARRNKNKSRKCEKTRTACVDRLRRAQRQPVFFILRFLFLYCVCAAVLGPAAGCGIHPRSSRTETNNRRGGRRPDTRTEYTDAHTGLRSHTGTYNQAVDTSK